LRCFITSEASSSPSASIRMAPLVILSSTIITDPRCDDVGDQLGIFLGNLFGHYQIFLVAVSAQASGRTAFIAAEFNHGTVITGRWQQWRCRRSELAYYRFKQAQIEQQDDDQSDDKLADILGHFDIGRLLP